MDEVMLKTILPRALRRPDVPTCSDNVFMFLLAMFSRLFIPSLRSHSQGGPAKWFTRV